MAVAKTTDTDSAAVVDWVSGRVNHLIHTGFWAAGPFHGNFLPTIPKGKRTCMDGLTWEGLKVSNHPKLVPGGSEIRKNKELALAPSDSSLCVLTTAVPVTVSVGPSTQAVLFFS